MNVILITILIVLVVLVLVLLAVLMSSLAAGRRDLSVSNSAITLLSEQLETVKKTQELYNQTLEKNLKDGQQGITKFLHSSTETLNRLHTEMAGVTNASKQMLVVGDEVRKLQDIFKNPKHRGQLGEMSLQKILEEILPGDSYRIQHQFKNNRIVDALIQMPDYSVSVDAKFPLPAFENILKAETDEKRSVQRRQFQRDVIKHIDKIASDYIVPDEGTLDFALMYIPAENVYYETIIKYNDDKQDVLTYALDKKVIPVSPNLLYAYLMTIVMGLRGLQIEKQAGEIRAALGKLSGGLNDFTVKWELLGKHLRNAYAQYDEGNKKLDRFTLEINQIHEDHTSGDK